MRRLLLTLSLVLAWPALAFAQAGTSGPPTRLPSIVAFTADITPAQITADQDNYNPAGLAGASVLRLCADAARNITGIAGGVRGRLLLVINICAPAITLKNDTTSTPANRFQLGSDVTLSADKGAFLVYDSTSSRWRAMVTPSGAAGTPGGSEGDLQAHGPGGVFSGLAPTDDGVPVGGGAAFTIKVIPNCPDSSGQHLNYTAATNTFSCGTSDANTGTVTSVNATVPQDTSISGGPITGAGALALARKAVHAIGNLGATPTISFNNGHYQTGTLNANASATLSNGVNGQWYFLDLTQDGTGGRTFAFSGNVTFFGGTTLTVNGAANARTLIRLYNVDGTNYLAWIDGGSHTATSYTTLSSAAGAVVLRDGSGNVVYIATATGPNFCTPSGGTDSYACAITVTIGADTFSLQAYATGMPYCFKADVANTGAASINFNSLGAKTIKKAAGGVTTDLADNDIRANQMVCLTYDGTNMQMQSTLGNAGAADLNTATGDIATAQIENDAVTPAKVSSLLYTSVLRFAMTAAVPSDGTGSVNNPPTATTLVSSGTQPTNGPKVTVPAWLFGASADEHLHWDFIVPMDYVSGGTLKGVIYNESLQSGTNNFVMKCAIAAVSTTERIDNKVYPALDTVTIALANNQAAGTTTSWSLALSGTALNSIAAGDHAMLTCGRDQDHASDTATGNMGLIALAIEYLKR